eukprot:TRINITY_DN87_c6_g1_i1.p1 TRINITY_DN87_c6_g1~~TRINITY_DN87_c6_g1_i1.p1  ORF type:complete len:664 (+),score=255.26 TRINITY_DN87_c6_g1_i1:23-2014(+)
MANMVEGLQVCIIESEVNDKSEAAEVLKELGCKSNSIVLSARPKPACIKISAHASAGAGVFLNLYHSCDPTEKVVISHMEENGFAFTGSDARTCNPSHMEIKRICRYSDIAARDLVAVADLSVVDLAAIASQLKGFPLAVMPPSDARDVLNVLNSSSVSDAKELQQKLEATIQEYGMAYVEKYQPSFRVFSLLLVGTKAHYHTYPAAEFLPSSSSSSPSSSCASDSSSSSSSSSCSSLTASYTATLFTYPSSSSSLTANEWSHGRHMNWRFLSDKEASLQNKLQSTAKAFFAYYEAEGYYRIDFRLDSLGVLTILQVFSNPPLFYSNNECIGDLMIQQQQQQQEKKKEEEEKKEKKLLTATPTANEKTTENEEEDKKEALKEKEKMEKEKEKEKECPVQPLTKSGVLRLLLTLALTRKQHYDKTHGYMVKYTPEKGHYLVARRDLREGELAYTEEESTPRIVTPQHVQRYWSETDKDLFARYCWPLGDDVCAIWSLDSSKWKPINHSCDPNCWLSGLDVIVHRPIKAGEELTIDYSTFEPFHPEFKCWCGAKNCRGKVGTNEWKEAWFEERYRGYFMPFIQSLIKRQKQVTQLETQIRQLSTNDCPSASDSSSSSSSSSTSASSSSSSFFARSTVRNICCVSAAVVAFAAGIFTAMKIGSKKL